jgi:hypothetical protein
MFGTDMNALTWFYAATDFKFHAIDGAITGLEQPQKEKVQLSIKHHVMKCM